MRDTEGTIGQHQNKTYNSYQSRSSINPKTKEIYSKHHRIETHHWITICGIKHHVQVGDYSRVRESEPHKRHKDGNEDGHIGVDDHHGDGSPDGTPAPPTERGRGSLPCASSSMASPLDGERFSLWSWAFMAMMAPPGSSSMASGDDGPLRQGAREGLD